jgi:Immunoglobulin I-set domain
VQDLTFVHISPDGRLTITGTQDVDAGEYECVATNEAGTSSAYVNLEIGGLCHNLLMKFMRKQFESVSLIWLNF